MNRNFSQNLFQSRWRYFALFASSLSWVWSPMAWATPNLQIAQAIAGQCRAARQSTFIYRERSTDNALRALSLNETVRLADNGSDGWIAVDQPTTGFVRTVDLKPCGVPPVPPVAPVPPPQPRPPMPSGVTGCRQVSWEEGLEVQQTPRGDRVGGVLYAQRVTLTGNTQVTFDPQRNANRFWGEISFPVRGWITTGVEGGGSNLVGCNVTLPRPRPVAVTPRPSICRQVTWPQGLTIYRAPAGEPIGGVGFQERVFLTGQERVLFDPMGGDRLWVQISSPLTGWVTNGLQGSPGRNLMPCP